MAEGTINAYNLAENGVNVDSAQIHKEDGELIKAQNCTTDPTGLGGGVRKRPGLIEFNGSAGVGSMLGGIGAPLTLLTNVIGGVTLAGGPTKTTYWARALNDANLGASQGWMVSTTNFTSAVSGIFNGTPGNPRSEQIDNFCTAELGAYNGSPGSGVVINNKFYYAANDYSEDTTAPVVRVFDGVVDSEVVRIPRDESIASSVYPFGILSMIAVGDTIYLTVIDQTDGGSMSNGRVFSLDSSSGALALIGARFNARSSGTDTVPYALGWHMGRLWCGVVNRQDTDPAGAVYWFRPGIDTTWTLDRTATTANSRGVAFLVSFQGRLFAGSIAGTSNGVVEVRSSVGSWSTSLTVAGQYFYNAIVFNNALYTVSNNDATGVSQIRKFDGSSWSIVHTTTGSDSRALTMCWENNGVLFFGGSDENSSAALLSSPDGTTWTSRTANLTAHTGLNNVAVLVS